MNISELLNSRAVILDGGMGTLLQAKGLKPGELPESWNISRPDIIRDIHKAYFDAGSNIVNANTFGANILKFSENELDSIIGAAINNAKEATSNSDSKKDKFVALDIGPTGKLLKPYGDLDFEDAVSIFAKTVKLGVKHGADLIMIETMNDSYETKAALLAAKENSNLPVFVCNAYGEDGKLMTGATPSAMVAMLEGMGADAIGINCSLGPNQIKGIVKEYLSRASIPVIVKPNAGLPQSVDGKTVFDVSAKEFAEDVAKFVKDGVSIAGGCCGTTPEYIAELIRLADSIEIKPITKKDITCVSSYPHAVDIGHSPILIGERINPTGKKRFKQALIDNDMDYILAEGIRQQECGVHILDVNVGSPDIDEIEMLTRTVCELQAVSALPLQIDTSDPFAMESALRRYNGKAMINSVNGKEESMKAIFPLVKKYGGVVVALTLDENGIPSDAEGRVKIANKILRRAEQFGIDKKDIIFDTLAMAISADNNAAMATLDALNEIKTKLLCNTSLGVSNISFGLPNRDIINSTFFAMALEKGLSAAIMNPYSIEMIKAYHAFCALNGLDENCANYIEFAQSVKIETATATNTASSEQGAQHMSELQRSIIKGLREQSAKQTDNMLCEIAPNDIVQNEIVPALDIVGQGFEKGKVFLPQLLMSAEAAKSAFERIKAHIEASGQKSADKCCVVIATVEGDIHDIGKNIVRLLLENYGYNVVDLGKDVPCEEIVEKVIELHAPIVGLSALMTTTVPAMEQTVATLHDKSPWCKVMVGGAVLTEEYAKRIGADKYAADAMESVRYAESIYNELTKEQQK